MIADYLFENGVEFSIFSNIINDQQITTVRIKSEPKISIIYSGDKLCMVSHADGLVMYVDELDIDFTDNKIKFNFFLEGTHVGDFVCEL